MTDLLKQDALQPHYEYTPPKLQALSKWCHYPCPLCGRGKHRVAPICRQCFISKNRPPVDPKTYMIGDEACRRIPLVGGQYSVVNESLYDRMMLWPWRFFQCDLFQPIYAITDIRVDENIQNNRTKFRRAAMHHVITSTHWTIPSDHKNRISLDNRISNLRPCTDSQSMANRGIRRDNSSGYIGVHRLKDRWISRIAFEGKRISIGSYVDVIEAAKARDAMAIKLFGEFAVLNFPLESPSEDLLDLVRLLTQGT